MATIVFVVETFVDILTSFLVFPQEVSFSTDTSIIIPIFFANLTTIRGFTHVGKNAVSPGIIQRHIVGTLTFVGSNQIRAIVRAFMRVFRALVHVDARACVLKNSISFRASASRSVLSVLAGVRTKIRQKGAILPLRASCIVVCQDESRRTRAHICTVCVVTDVGARSRWLVAFVHVFTRCTIFFEFVTGTTNAMIATRFVHALVLAAVRFILDALVYI